MELWLQILIGVGTVVVIGVLLYLWFGVYMAKQKNAYCRGRVGKLCDAMAKRGGHICLHNVRLPYQGKTVKLDHVVVGTFGVVVANGYDGHGDLYGARDDQNWYVYNKENQKKTIPNPMTRMNNGITAMRELFAKTGVYNVTSVDAFIVFGNGVKLNVSYGDRDPADVLLLKRLAKPLRREKYLRDAKTDPQKVAEALRTATANQR